MRFAIVDGRSRLPRMPWLATTCAAGVTVRTGARWSASVLAQGRIARDDPPIPIVRMGSRPICRRWSGFDAADRSFGMVRTISIRRLMASGMKPLSTNQRFSGGHLSASLPA